MKWRKSMERNVLIAPIGTEAQIVTTTIDLLKTRHISIDEVIVLHSVGNSLLEEAAQMIQTELREYPNLAYTIKPFSRNEEYVKNMDTPKEVDILFYSIYNEVRKQKNLENTVYLLCSGGRKIIAAYAMLTAQMLFDRNDRLLYLISKGEYLQSKAMHPLTEQDYLEANLLEIPFLEWSAVLPSISEVREIEEPAEAYARIQDLQLQVKYGKSYDFIMNQCTKSERKVLKLAAGKGLTNAQIAEELIVSERTIESHMRSMLRKAAFYFEDSNLTRSQLIVLTQTYYQMKLNEGDL